MARTSCASYQQAKYYHPGASNVLEKRYQVFVSSTFLDLQEERQEVMQALLELDCIPAGMELFPAANQDQWTLIKKVIDDCDYYILISAGRYGSIGPDGISYTEMEYRYALERRKPIIAFLHKSPEEIPAKACESTDDGKAKLTAFREMVRAKMVRHWESAAELGSQASRSLVKLMKVEPAVGWVRADSLPSEDTTRELLALRRRVEELEKDLQNVRLTAPSGTENLAQGDDEFCVELVLPYRSKDDEDQDDRQYGFETTWNAIFAAMAPKLMDEASEATMKAALLTLIHSIGVERLNDDDDIVTYDDDIDAWAVVDADFETIKVQLRALGLIAKSTKPRSLRDSRTMWTLTPLGDDTMSKLRAVRKP